MFVLHGGFLCNWWVVESYNHKKKRNCLAIAVFHVHLISMSCFTATCHFLVKSFGLFCSEIAATWPEFHSYQRRAYELNWGFCNSWLNRKLSSQKDRNAMQSVLHVHPCPLLLLAGPQLTWMRRFMFLPFVWHEVAGGVGGSCNFPSDQSNFRSSRMFNFTADKSDWGKF